MPSLDDWVGLDPATRTAIEAAIAEHHILQDVVRWRPIASVVTQDEYTHDVMVLWDDQLCLVYDTTWLGGITAVAVWDHQPDADELLRARVANGWQPTATSMRHGDEILGHAACLVDPRDGKPSSDSF